MATTPEFTLPDYLKFFSAGALAATLTHGVRIPSSTSSQLTAPCQ